MTRRRSPSPPPPPPRIELTPMIDVTFLILVFFLCTIQLRSLEGRLESHLPRHSGAGTASELPRARARVVLRVLEPGSRLHPAREQAWSGSGPYRHGPDRLVRYDVGPHSTTRLADVRAWLAAVLARDPDLEVVVDARAGTSYADVVEVVDLGREVGCGSITFAAAR